MPAVPKRWRPLVLALAAAVFSAGDVPAQGSPPGELIGRCAACHGADGNSGIEKYPSLAGQPELFLVNQLFLMREGVRRVEAMAALVKELKDADIKALAKHFSQLTPKPSDETIDPAQVRRGAELAAARRCESCHGSTLAGQQQIPRVAKQRVDYLVQAMKEFRDDRRTGADTIMGIAVAGLADADLVALAHYAASR